MSRSYKRIPISKDKIWLSKRTANKMTRAYLKQHPEERLVNQEYKKIVESSNIHDYISYYSWPEYWDLQVKQWYNWRHEYEPFPDKHKAYRDWRKWYKNK